MIATEDNLKDLEPKPVHTLMSKTWQRIIIITSCVFSLAATVFNLFETVQRADYVSTPEFVGNIVGVFVFYGIAIPAIATVLASPFALIPLKSYTYKEKHRAYTLMVVLALQPLLVMSAITTYINKKRIREEGFEFRDMK